MANGSGRYAEAIGLHAVIAAWYIGLTFGLSSTEVERRFCFRLFETGKLLTLCDGPRRRQNDIGVGLRPNYFFGLPVETRSFSVVAGCLSAYFSVVICPVFESRYIVFFCSPIVFHAPTYAIDCQTPDVLGCRGIKSQTHVRAVKPFHDPRNLRWFGSLRV